MEMFGVTEGDPKIAIVRGNTKKNAIHARCDALVVLKKCGHAACFVH